VEIDDWGGDAPLVGTVQSVEPAAFTHVSALGVEEQRVHVVVTLAGAPASLGDGYRVEAHIVVWEAPSVVRVPISALFRHGEGWAVFVVAGGRAQLRSVELGERGAEQAEVRGGLAEGDRVVVYPSDQLRDGARVRVN
jgi:HlyD family secretion protein